MNSWKDWINDVYANCLADTAIMHAVHTTPWDELKLKLATQKAMEEFYHGITPNIRRLSHPCNTAGI